MTIDFAAAPSKADILRLRCKTGMVFQHYNLFPCKTALENVMEAPGVVQGQSWEQARQEALRLLAKVGLAERANHYPHQLPGGQQQQVGIALALVLLQNFSA